MSGLTRIGLWRWRLRFHNMLFILEAVIWLFLIVGGAFFLELFVVWKEGKANAWKKAVAIVLSLGLAVVFYGSFIEPKLLTVNENSISLYSFENSFTTSGKMRVALMSDLHMGWWKDAEWAKQVVERVNGENLSLY